MTVGVVQLLEVVQVSHGECKGDAARVEVPHSILERAAVEEASERIRGRLQVRRLHDAQQTESGANVRGERFQTQRLC